MIIYVYRGTEIASPRPRQGRAKAAPRPRHAASRPRQGPTRKKRTTDVPKGHPRCSCWGYLKPISEPWRAHFLVNCTFFVKKMNILKNLEQIFDDFQHGLRCPTRLLARRRGRSPLNKSAALLRRVRPVNIYIYISYIII